MAGGEGFIDGFQMTDPDHCRPPAKVPTVSGGRTAGYFGWQGKDLDRFYLAVPVRGAQTAEMRICPVQD